MSAKQTRPQIRRIAKPSARELYDNRHQAIDIEKHQLRLCACILMHDHEEKETIHG